MVVFGIFQFYTFLILIRSAGAIIGIVIGSIIGLSVFITIIICICDNRTNKRSYCGHVITSSPTIAYVCASNTCSEYYIFSADETIHIRFDIKQNIKPLQRLK